MVLGRSKMLLLPREKRRKLSMLEGEEIVCDVRVYVVKARRGRLFVVLGFLLLSRRIFLYY